MPRKEYNAAQAQLYAPFISYSTMATSDGESSWVVAPSPDGESGSDDISDSLLFIATSGDGTPPDSELTEGSEMEDTNAAMGEVGAVRKQNTVVMDQNPGMANTMMRYIANFLILVRVFFSFSL
jgi:hypothetical protein